MPAYEVHGPFGIQFNLQTRIPGVLSIVYASREERMSAFEQFDQTGESSHGPSSSRSSTTQSELTLVVPAPIYPPPSADNAVRPVPLFSPTDPKRLTHTHTQAPAPRSSAPSPAPTEIIPTDLTPEEIIEDIKRMGIKVRDFAYEPIPEEKHAPEIFDPVMSWNQYEDAIANPDPKRNAFSGRALRRLLDLGWISEAADRSRWMKKDREALEEFDSRPQYPWRALKLAQPTKEKLKEAARARLQFVHGGQWPPEVLARGLARIGGLLQRKDPPSSAEKRPADDAVEEQEVEGSPQSKKVRLSNGSPAQPDSALQPPLALVNGKAPQQFPAGRLPGCTTAYYPSRAPVVSNHGRQSPAGPSQTDSRALRASFINGKPPKQYPAGYPSDHSSRSRTGSPMGRSLQRQPTLTAIYPSDPLSRSDSRTALAESAQS
ncbi:hypothetical protein ID866_8068 [Astraeus odoratus]|nr:hypothetical protein ID866_8068 [Astraeus odoratus]